MVLNFVLCAVLLLSAIFIIVAVIFQKSADEGLSGTIAGGNETFYGKEKSAHADKLWFKLTLIASVVFVIAVLLAYVVQPDYDSASALDSWKDSSQYKDMLKNLFTK
jgi:preprotein translocase subunit SecG